MFYYMFYFTCDRSFTAVVMIAAVLLPVKGLHGGVTTDRYDPPMT